MRRDEYRDHGRRSDQRLVKFLDCLNSSTRRDAVLDLGLFAIEVGNPHLRRKCLAALPL